MIAAYLRHVHLLVWASVVLAAGCTLTAAAVGEGTRAWVLSVAGGAGFAIGGALAVVGLVAIARDALRS